MDSFKFFLIARAAKTGQAYKATGNVYPMAFGAGRDNASGLFPGLGCSDPLGIRKVFALSIYPEREIRRNKI